MLQSSNFSEKLIIILNFQYILKYQRNVYFQPMPILITANFVKRKKSVISRDWNISAISLPD